MLTKTLEELIDERDAIQRKLNAIFAHERELAFTRIRELMQQYSIGMVDLAQRTRVNSKSGIKYRDPETGNAWTGRGRRPGWMRGRDPAKFLIDRTNDQNN